MLFDQNSPVQTVPGTGGGGGGAKQQTDIHRGIDWIGPGVNPGVKWHWRNYQCNSKCIVNNYLPALSWSKLYLFSIPFKVNSFKIAFSISLKPIHLCTIQSCQPNPALQQPSSSSQQPAHSASSQQPAASTVSQQWSIKTGSRTSTDTPTSLESPVLSLRTSALCRVRDCRYVICWRLQAYLATLRSLVDEAGLTSDI